MIEVTGLEEIRNKLTTLRDSLFKIEPKLKTIGNMVKNDIEDSFTKEASPFGAKWSPLKLSTLKAKARKNQGQNILRASGTLQDTWLVSTDANSVTVSGNAKSSKGYAYGAVHQFGSAKKNIPARPFLPVDASGALEPKLLKTINDYLNNEISRVL